MTDHSADGEIKDSTHIDSQQDDQAHKAADLERSAPHAEASLVPESSDMAGLDAKAVDAPEDAVSTHVAKQSSREITLQRLTPHSSWEDYAFREESEHAQAANDTATAPEAGAGRRLSLAAIVTIAATVGAIGGSLATAGVGHYLKGDQTAAIAAEQARSTEGAVAKMAADIAALKTNASAQSAKLAERIEKVEKAQAEPAVKLAKLSEAVDKLRTPAPAVAAAATPAPETTGSIKQAVAQPSRLPVVEGWALRDVYDGTATVVGRAGIFDVIPGDPLPGVGRVDAIRRQDGRWVVVTSRGLIVAR